MQIHEPTLSPPPRHEALWTKARELEAGFLSEMLRHAGLADRPASLGGGIGEEQFASFLRDAQAEAMVKAGGIGLAERIFESLVRRETP